MWANANKGTARASWVAMAAMSAALVGGTPAMAQAPAQSGPAKTSKDAKPSGAEQTPPSAGAPVRPAADSSAGTKDQCQHYVDVLAGKSKDAKLLDDPVVGELARRVPDLVTCGAVATDSEDLCKALAKGAIEAQVKCRQQTNMMHEVRHYPKGRSFFFTDVEMEQCEQFGPTKPYCKSIRDIARSGDASKCTSLSFLADTCRAFLTIDKSNCRAPSGPDLAAATQGQPEAAQKDLATGIQQDCVKKIDDRAFLAKGLSDVAASDRPEAKLAKAALGQADACAGDVGSAMTACTKLMAERAAPPPAGGAAPAGSEAPPAGSGAPPAGGAPAAPGAPNVPAAAPDAQG